MANVNRAANTGINYRLVDLGFGTNKNDSNIMLNQMDKVAVAVKTGIYGVVIDTPQQQDSMAG